MKQLTLVLAALCAPLAAQTAYAVDSNLDILYTVDLATGAAKPVGKIAGLSGSVSDIAILPGK